MLNNFLCDNEIFHYRKIPFKNFFKYKICSILINIKKIKKLNKLVFFSVNKFNIFSINLKEYGSPKKDLYTFINEQLQKRYNSKNKHDIYLLTSPRFFGYIFNPISIYFISYKKKIKYIIYEVRNTHHEKHMYFKKINQRSKRKHVIDKKFYVSPFLKMNLKYFFSIFFSKKKINIRINVLGKNEKLYTGMDITCMKLNDKNLLKMAFKRAFFAQKIIIMIHFQAIKIFFKKSKFNFKNKNIKNNHSYS